MKLIETLHIASAVLFIIDYVVKSMLLVFDKNTALDKYKAYTKVISMIISTIFLVTGILAFILFIFGGDPTKLGG